MKRLAIRTLEERDVPLIFTALDDPSTKPRSQYERYLSEQQRGVRTVLVALVGGELAGSRKVTWPSTGAT